MITGMRQMELLGLKWTDLDWVNQTLKADRQLARRTGGEVSFTQPKTRYDKRTVVLGSGTVQALQKYNKRQNLARQKAAEN